MYKLINKDINLLVGRQSISKIALEPFNKQICEFLNILSHNILKNKISRQSSDLIAASFWCSKNNILKLKKDYKDIELRFGKGLVFHITPSNVPTNFFYSLIFG
jgi:hypothetical protein